MRFLLLVVPLSIIGCGAVEKVEDRAEDLIGKGVKRYRALSPAEQEVVREKLDKATAPCELRLHCPVDESAMLF